jgi:hypothetical protein
MLQLYFHSIKLGKKHHQTCVYTDTPEIFRGTWLIDEVKVIPGSFEFYFLDDIKFYVMEREVGDYTLIDGDYFLDRPLPQCTTTIGIEHIYQNDHVGERFNNILVEHGIKEIIPYWENGYDTYNLGLVQVNNFQLDEFLEDYRKVKEFYKTKIDGKYLDRMKECIEISTCQYLFTMFNRYKGNTSTELRNKIDIHLNGLNPKKKWLDPNFKI